MTCSNPSRHVWHWNGDVQAPDSARCDCQKWAWSEREGRPVMGWHTKKLHPYRLDWESIWRYK